MNVTDFPELRNVCNYKEYTQNPPLRTQTWGLGYPSTMLTALVTESRDWHGIKRAWYSPFFRYFSWFENKSFSFLNLKMRQARQALLPPLMLLSRQVCHLSTLHSSKFFDSENWRLRTSLLVQWFGLHALTAEGMGSIPSQGTQIPQAAWHSQKKKKNPLRLHWRPVSHLYCWWSIDWSEALEGAVPEKGSTFRVKTPSDDHENTLNTRSSHR